MQFPNPIITSFIIRDNNGNPVVIIGPGPFIKIVNPTSNAELDMDAGTTFPEILFWNSAHTFFGKISLEVATFSTRQMIIIRSPPDQTFTIPGNPDVEPRIFLTSEILLGNVLPIGSDNGIGGQLQLDESSFGLHVNDSTTPLSLFRVGMSAQASTKQIWFTDSVNTGVAFDAGTAELRTLNTGTVLDWTNLTLQNGWTAKAGYYTPQYRFTPTGMLELRGTMTGGTNADNTVICLMPIVPAKLGLADPHMPGGGTVNKRLFYNTDGKLYCYGVAGAADLGLDGITLSYK